MDFQTIINWFAVQQYYAAGGDLWPMMMMWGLRIASGLFIVFVVLTTVMWFFLPWSTRAINKRLNKLISSLELSHLYSNSIDQSLDEINKRGNSHEEHTDIEDLTDHIIEPDGD